MRPKYLGNTDILPLRRSAEHVSREIFKEALPAFFRVGDRHQESEQGRTTIAAESVRAIAVSNNKLNS